MRIEFDGQTQSHKMIRRALWYFSELLMDSDQRAKDFVINILPASASGLDDMGLLPVDCEDVVGATYVQPGLLDSRLAKQFTIVFDPTLTPGQVFQTLAHEMVHVAQYVSGDLYVVWNGESMDEFWKGVHVPSSDDYMSLPWEEEAYRLGDELLQGLIEENDFESWFVDQDEMHV